MDGKQAENLDQLLAALNVDDPKELAVKVMEALGLIVLSLHWLRGMFNVLEHHNAIAMPQAGQDNLHLLRDSLAKYEELLWRIVPPRAVTLQIGVFRDGGYLDEEFLKLFFSDGLGRATGQPKVEEIREVLERVKSEDKRTVTPNGD